MGGVGNIRRGPRVSWTAMAVEGRHGHARLAVKLETSGAQLTTKGLIVGTSVRSHSGGTVGGGPKGGTEVETHFAD